MSFHSINDQPTAMLHTKIWKKGKLTHSVNGVKINAKLVGNNDITTLSFSQGLATNNQVIKLEIDLTNDIKNINTNDKIIYKDITYFISAIGNFPNKATPNTTSLILTLEG